MKAALFIETQKYYFFNMLIQLNPKYSKLKKGPLTSNLEINLFFYFKMKSLGFGAVTNINL